MGESPNKSSWIFIALARIEGMSLDVVKSVMLRRATREVGCQVHSEIKKSEDLVSGFEATDRVGR